MSDAEQLILKSKGIVTETRAIILLKYNDFDKKYELYKQAKEYIVMDDNLTEFFVSIDTAYEMKEITEGIYAILKDKKIEGITYMLDY